MKHQYKSTLYILSFPVVLSIGIFLIPVVADYSNHQLASEGVEQTTRWFLGHIIAAVAFGLSLLSVTTIEEHLRRVSYQLPGFIKIFIGIGAGLYGAGLGADGIGPIAINASTSDPSLFFNGSGWWVTGTFMAGTAFFGVGLLSLIGHINNAKIVEGAWRYVAFISALIFVVVPAIPSGWGLYGEALACYGAFLPVGISVLRSS